VEDHGRQLRAEGRGIFRGDRHDNADGSDDADAQQKVTQPLVKTAHVILLLCLAHGFDEHPQRQ
jgi:hypothetical protein